MIVRAFVAVVVLLGLSGGASASVKGVSLDWDGGYFDITPACVQSVFTVRDARLPTMGIYLRDNSACAGRVKALTGKLAGRAISLRWRNIQLAAFAPHSGLDTANVALMFKTRSEARKWQIIDYYRPKRTVLSD